MNIRLLWICLGVISTLFSVSSSNAETLEKTPVMLKADKVYVDREKGFITAVGNVEVTQANRILLTDTLLYNQNSDKVVARGNVRFKEPNGDIFYSHITILQNQFRDGVIRNLRARLSDNSYLAANEARRIDGNVIEMDKAVYSPCPLCKGGKSKTPLWQIKAKKVVLDEEKERVEYRHAFFELYETPVFYTPYFSHATPNAKRRSGFMTPTYSTISTLGNSFRIPYYVNIKENMDATVIPIFTTKEGLVLASEFRHLTSRGQYRLFGSITNPDNFKTQETGIERSGHKLRGHIEGNGLFRLNENWNLGFNGKRALDDTYLRRYRFGNEDTLTSRIYAEGIDGRNYAAIEGLSFQGLNVDDTSSQTPVILPMVTTHHEGNINLLNSLWKLDSNLRILSREQGTQNRRLSMKGTWQIPYTTSNGHVFHLNSSLRGDLYHVDDFLRDASDPNSKLDNSFAGRVIPQAELRWRYPLMKSFTTTRLFLEPTAEVILSPYGSNSSRIPNEDSQDIEFSDGNLFSQNRHSGLDRVEDGHRFNYGFRGSLFGFHGTQASFLFGQSYRAKEDQNFSAESGLDDNFSDYVGRLNFKTKEFMDASYRFRLDYEDFSSRRDEVNANFSIDPSKLKLQSLKFTINYLSLNEEFAGDDEVREEIFASTAIGVLPDWNLTAHARKDLTNNGGWVTTGASVLYDGECLDFSLLWQRDFTRDRDLEPSTSITFRVLLKNIN